MSRPRTFAVNFDDQTADDWRTIADHFDESDSAALIRAVRSLAANIRRTGRAYNSSATRRGACTVRGERAAAAGGSDE